MGGGGGGSNAIAFPGSPTAGQTYQYQGKTYMYTGVYWAIQKDVESLKATAEENYVLSGNGSTGPATFKPSLTNVRLESPKERTTVSSSAASGTINYDCGTQADLYYTGEATGNFSINFRYSSSVTFASNMAFDNETASFVFRNTNGSTGYYLTSITIDGVSVTPKWLGGNAPSSGNASAVDVYSFVITRKPDATFVVFASVSKFA